MTVSDFEQYLLDAAVNQLSEGRDWLRLVLDKPVGNGKHMIVLQKPRVKGEVLCENSDGKAVVLVKATDVLRWCEAQRKTRNT